MAERRYLLILLDAPQRVLPPGPLTRDAVARLLACAVDGERLVEGFAARLRFAAGVLPGDRMIGAVRFTGDGDDDLDRVAGALDERNRILGMTDEPLTTDDYDPVPDIYPGELRRLGMAAAATGHNALLCAAALAGRIDRAIDLSKHSAPPPDISDIAYDEGEGPVA